MPIVFIFTQSIMSYTTKVIFISLAVWLALSLLCGFIMALSGEEYWVLGIMIAGMITGIAGVAGLVITAAVILLGKLNGKKLVPPGPKAPLDAKPAPLHYRERGMAFLAAAGVILLIGGSVCFGML